MLSVQSAVATFGAAAKSKLGNVAVSGEPEDQLRAPLEHLLLDLAELCGIQRESVVAVGESRIADLKTRPDFAVTVGNAPVGFIEVKAPGKGADPRRFRGRHDKEQWAKLQSLPNLLYTDGNQFSLWQDGELAADIVRLEGDVESSGAELRGSHALLVLFDNFLRWSPVAPRDVKQLANLSARLCRFLREEVTEQLALKNQALTTLATGWRKMLFPEATDAQFADGYAQAVTFGLLVARAKEIPLTGTLDEVAKQLGETNSLIGAALRIVTQEVENEAALKTSLATMTRVLDVVQWAAISKGIEDAWLYFYEDFLEVYDNALRKRTGSYYTPPEVVGSMIRLVDETLRSPGRFNQARGLASADVTVADPAVGTGTFILGVLNRIAKTVEESEGAGAVPAAVGSALDRLIAFEMQLGPFAVAQLRVLAEIAELTGKAPNRPLKMFVTDTLGDPYVEEDWLPNIFKPIAESRRQANQIKKHEPITVILGNPPYRERAKGMGGWVENGGTETAILQDWMPPVEWGVGAHAKHLRNLYVYFWRWATWKVFDNDETADKGVVCFITVAGFLNGPGFQQMRAYLRQRANEVWVIDCSPEGHQPPVNTRIFQGVQQPVCIVLVSKTSTDKEEPAVVRYRALPAGNREAKFAALQEISLDKDDWIACSSSWRAPFLPALQGAWATFPSIEDFFIYTGSGVMPGRTWVIAPDKSALEERWQALLRAAPNDKEKLFHPHRRRGKLGDRHTQKVLHKGLHGHEERTGPVNQDDSSCVKPVRFAYRSFDRQWIIPDNRLINQPNPRLWKWHSESQIYLTVLTRISPTSGPAITFAAAIPDLDYYHGRGGRILPLFQDGRANVRPALLEYLTTHFGSRCEAEEVTAYIAALVAHPGYTQRFAEDLVRPGLRVPLSADSSLFSEAVDLGKRIIWLHTFGERCVSAKEARPQGAPRLPAALAPRVPKEGAIPNDPDAFPDTLNYEPTNRRLRVGKGFVDNVPPEVWNYEVSGKHVLRHWFSYRKADRSRPLIGNRRPPSALNQIQAKRWLPEYTSDLIDLVNVLALLAEQEEKQIDLLNRICEGPLLSQDALTEAGALSLPKSRGRKAKATPGQGNLLDNL